MKLNTYFNQVSDMLTRRVFWKLQEEVNALPLSVVQGEVYYVENNAGSDSNDGKSWDTAFKTLAVAIAANNTNIALSSKTWAARNTIYYKADTETVNLVAFPNKCDVIGVGSYDANKKPGITGRHVPVNAGNYGTRFINVWFKAIAHASPIVTLANSSSGIEFIGCTFDGSIGTVTRAILATASPFLKVIGCNIFGTFATNYIAFGIGETAGTLIEGNQMTGMTGVGIVDVDTTTASYASVIKDNFITVDGDNKCINDIANSDAGIFYVINNNCLSTGATVTAIAHHAAVLNINLTRASNNFCMGSGTQQVTCPTFVAT